MCCTMSSNSAEPFLLFSYPNPQTAPVALDVKRPRPLLGKKLEPSAFVTSKEESTNISTSLGPRAHSMERILSLIAGLEPRLRRMWLVKELP